MSYRHGKLFSLSSSESLTAIAHMRYAIVSDLHGNLRAWNAVLADLHRQRADIVVCLGDVVGYGPNPSEVLNGVRSVCENFVMGNHDAATVGKMDYSIFNDHARQAIDWTIDALNPEAKEFLSKVPLSIEAGENFFVHAEIVDPKRFDYIWDSTIAKENFAANKHQVTFVGHTHQPKIFEQDKKGDVTELPDNDIHLAQDKRYIVNVGSVGEPRDPDDLRGRYVIYDSNTREVVFRRVEFDIVSYREDLEATSLTLRPYFLKVYEELAEGHTVSAPNDDSLVEMKMTPNSKSFIDQGQVASVAHLSNSGTLLKSSRPSRAPVLSMAIAAILILGAFGFWLLQGDEKRGSSIAKIDPKPNTTSTSEPAPVPKRETAADSNTLINTEMVEKVTPKNQPAPMVPDEKTSRPETTAAIIADTPEKPTPVPRPTPKPPEPIPEPEVTPSPVEIAWWRMGDGKDEDALIDQEGRITLVPVVKGRTIKALAPNPVPENQTENNAAKQLGVWQEENPNNHFALTIDHSFTFEGWLFIEPFRQAIFLIGTRSSQEDGRGWHLDLRPGAVGKHGESITFFYDSGALQTQAMAEDLELADGKAHHFAIVWDHDAKPDEGWMKVYLDGEEMASANLPHSQIIGEQIHPFRVGAEFNRAKLGLDELRFTRKTLQPHEFLLRAPIKGISLVKADGRSTDSWSIPENWENGKVPSGALNVIIGPDLKVQISKSKPPAFTGSLVIKQDAALCLWSEQGENILPKTEGKLVMFENSRLIITSKKESKLGPIELLQKAFIYGGISTSGHHTTRIFASKISGAGELVVIGVNGNTFIFDETSSFSGGTRTKPQKTQKFKVIAAEEGCFGKGRVVIGDHSSLLIQQDLKNTIADDTDLILNGPKGTLDTKLVLDSDETVGRFAVDDRDQGKGVFTKNTHPEIISGDGELTVE